MSTWRESNTEGPDIRGNVGRGRDADREGAEAEQFLGELDFPVRKGEIVGRASDAGAPPWVRRVLERLPDREFGSIVEVSRAIGEAGLEGAEEDEE